MKFSLEWLKHFLDTDASVPEIAAALNRIGHEVEGIEDPADKLAGFRVAHVLTAESAGAYKPHMRAFEYMFDTLNCGPEDVLHVSSSFRYDLMTAHDLGIANKVWVNRGHEPANPYYGYTEIADISGLPGVLGL